MCWKLPDQLKNILVLTNYKKKGGNNRKIKNKRKTRRNIRKTRKY
jgi:hypothetical protein